MTIVTTPHQNDPITHFDERTAHEFAHAPEEVGKNSKQKR
jgi:hypothetical protein